jgi:hypothetical protein
MTNPNPFSGGAVGRVVAAPRALAAWALLAFTALFLFFTFFSWLLGPGSFSGRSASAGFRNLFEMALPVLAVILATYIAPVLPGARVMAVIALAEYAVALFFGVITLLIGLGAVLDNVDTAWDSFNALQYLVMGLAALALIAIAAYVTLRAFLSLGGRVPNFTPGPATPPAPPAA